MVHTKANYTKDTVYRPSRMGGRGGPCAKKLSECYSVDIGRTRLDNPHNKQYDYISDVARFQAEFEGEQLFGYYSGRKHHHFPLVGWKWWILESSRRNCYINLRTLTTSVCAYLGTIRPKLLWK